MAVTSEPDNTPLPGTVFTPRQVRLLKIAVIVMGILLVGGFAFVMAAIVYQASNLGKGKVRKEVATSAAIEAVPELALAIPAGANVTALTLDGDRLAFQLQGPAGYEIVVVDIASGKVLSRIRLKAQ